MWVKVGRKTALSGNQLFTKGPAFMLISCLSFSALQHAGKHMEDSIVASYSALLLGCLCQESPVSITSCHFLGGLKNSWLVLNQKGLYFSTKNI